MSLPNIPDPLPGDARAADAIEQVFVASAKDIGGFEVRRAFPAAGRQMVGPFIFLDQFGPVLIRAGQGFDVRPHPHIGLATVTWLFDGHVFHRDSLGSAQTIAPGELNWMTAGRGIVHSERTPVGERSRDRKMFGIQCWVALPRRIGGRRSLIRSRQCGRTAADRGSWCVGDGWWPVLFMASARRSRRSRICSMRILRWRLVLRTPSGGTHRTRHLSCRRRDRNRRSGFRGRRNLWFSVRAPHHHPCADEFPHGGAGRRAHGGPPPYLVEFRFVLEGQDRGGQERLETCTLRDRTWG